jgi:hypothetical protein
MKDDNMENANPNLKWYTEISERKGLMARCPFAFVYRCPRYYASLSPLAYAGSTPIEPEEDRRLKERWLRSDLWPVTEEQKTSVLGPSSGPQQFWRFCPEVLFDRFGVFASALADYHDDIDRKVAHARLSEQDAASDDAEWSWALLHPMHYSECPLYSGLQLGEADRGPKRPIGFVR